MPPFPASPLLARAAELGFTLAGVTPARPAPHLAAYQQWLAAGCHGAMHYLARADRVARRRDPALILPKAQTLISVGLNYYTPPPPEVGRPHHGQFAMYAWGRDYHELLQARLQTLADWLRREAAQPIQCRAYVDTGALLERGHAQQAGLGFIGKNTLLIHPRQGSYFFLGEILTDLVIAPYAEPGVETRCGTCARCLRACPTGALVQPYTLDARRCLSYLTIEHPGWIKPSLRPRLGNRVFGCDECQAVCPWQKFAGATAEPDLQPLSPEHAAPPLTTLLALDEAKFEARYQATAVHRLGRARLVRNACVAAGNSGQAELIPALQLRLTDTSPLVRGHAAWALAQLAGPAALPRLAQSLAAEPDPAARADMETTCQSWS